MNNEKRGGCCSPRILFITPVVGVFFAFAFYYYFQYTYARFVKVDFSESVFYTKDSLFVPELNRYKVIFYSSNIEEQLHFVQKLSKEQGEGILAIDFHQNRNLESSDDRIYITSGANTILKTILLFKVSQLPTIVLLERVQKDSNLYAQLSPARVVSQAEMKILLREQNQ